MRDVRMKGFAERADVEQVETWLASEASPLAAEPVDLKTVIETETARIEAEIATRRSTLLSLRHIAQAGGLAPYDIAIRERPGAPVRSRWAMSPPVAGRRARPGTRSVGATPMA